MAESNQPHEMESNGEGISDEGDAGFFTSSSRSRGPMAKMPVEKDSMHYNMQHERRGLALIFNHEFFDNPSLNHRRGTNVDANKLKDTLGRHQFEVVELKDYTLKKMQDEIERVAMLDHSKADCLMVFILSHGENGILFAKDTGYRPEKLWTPFTADQCPSLAGKPKMFFIQACQGDRVDDGVVLRTQTDGFLSGVSYKIPTHADFLIAYSTIPGFYSWRNPDKGSWFMQAFCEMFRQHGQDYDLMTLMTFVLQRVAIGFESCHNDAAMHGKKQIPCVTTMLTRLVTFPPKP